MSRQDPSGARTSRLRAELVKIDEVGPELQRRWQELEDAAVEPNPFFGPSIAMAAAQHLEGGDQDLLLVVWHGEEMDLAIPLRMARRYRRVPARTARVWGHSQAFLDTPLVRPCDPEGAFRVALRMLGSRRLRWCAFERLPADGEVRRALDAAVRAEGCRGVVLDESERPIVRRRPEPSYLDHVSGNRRRRLRRSRRRLSEAVGGDVEVSTWTASRVDEHVQSFLELETSGWKGREGTSMASAAEADFFRAAMRALAAQGRAQAWELRRGDQLLSVVCGAVGGAGSFHLKTAYDERLGAHSPGMLLEAEILDFFHQDPSLSWIDSCVSGEGESPSSVLYPDRRTMHTLVVAGGVGWIGAARALGRALARRERRRQPDEG